MGTNNVTSIEKAVHPVVVRKSDEEALTIIEQSMKYEKERLQERVERLDSSLQEGDAFSKAMKGSKIYLQTQGYLVSNETKEARILYKAYKEFYGKEPNLNHENRRNLTIEMQAMAFLLAHYGIMFYSYSFHSSVIADINMPISMDLQDIFVIKLLGRTKKEVDSDIEIKEDVKEAIHLLGAKITAATNEKEDPVEALRLITAIYHTETNVLPNASISEIAERTKCSIEEVESVKELAKSLKTDEDKNI